MKFFIDWEFEEKVYPSGKVIVPISLGIVSETGKELYLINEMYDWAAAHNWLKMNVLPSLKTVSKREDTTSLDIKNIHPIDFGVAIATWIKINKDETDVELIGYYADYDHVLLNQQFPSFDQYPTHLLPMYTLDLKQWIIDLGNPEILIENSHAHNALSDARWNKDVYKYLVENYTHPKWSKSYDFAIKTISELFDNLEFDEDDDRYTLDADYFNSFVTKYQILIK